VLAVPLDAVRSARELPALAPTLGLLAGLAPGAGPAAGCRQRGRAPTASVVTRRTWGRPPASAVIRRACGAPGVGEVPGHGAGRRPAGSGWPERGRRLEWGQGPERGRWWCGDAGRSGLRQRPCGAGAGRAREDGDRARAASRAESASATSTTPRCSAVWGGRPKWCCSAWPRCRRNDRATKAQLRQRMGSGMPGVGGPPAGGGGRGAGGR